MPRRARIALIGAAAGIVLLAITWYVVHYVGVAKRADVDILSGFAQLDRPGLNRLTNFVAHLCDPQRYVFLAAIPVIVALVRRRPRSAAVLAGILLAANETTQLLKPLLAAPRDLVSWDPISTASWPSGHATAAMSLALCMVIAAPPRRRPAVAAAMAVFAIAVSYSFLELGWHYPSDVLGGFLVAATWTLLGIAGLSTYEQRHPRTVPEHPDLARPRAAAISVGEALRPAAAMLAIALGLFGLIVLARPHQVIAYAQGHEVFMVGAASIGVLGVLLSSGLTLMLRRNPSD
jgi:membrane-associated phospholipid phosphatase